MYVIDYSHAWKLRTSACMTLYRSISNEYVSFLFSAVAMTTGRWHINHWLGFDSGLGFCRCKKYFWRDSRKNRWKLQKKLAI